MKKVQVVNCYGGEWIKIIGFITLLTKKCNDNGFDFDNAVTYAKMLAQKERLAFVFDNVTDSNGKCLSICYPNKSNVFCYIQEVFELGTNVTDTVNNDKIALSTVRDFCNVVTEDNLLLMITMFSETLTLYVHQLKALQINDRQMLFVDRIEVDKKDL